MIARFLILPNLNSTLSVRTHYGVLPLILLTLPVILSVPPVPDDPPSEDELELLLRFRILTSPLLGTIRFRLLDVVLPTFLLESSPLMSPRSLLPHRR